MPTYQNKSYYIDKKFPIVFNKHNFYQENYLNFFFPFLSSNSIIIKVFHQKSVSFLTLTEVLACVVVDFVVTLFSSHLRCLLINPGHLVNFCQQNNFLPSKNKFQFRESKGLNI